MKPSAILLGSIGVLMETSDIQRRAYNQAMHEAGVGWHWDTDAYRELLERPGGRARLSRLSLREGRGLSNADIERIHARKTEIACEAIVHSGLSLRPGVGELIRMALDHEVDMALVTTTNRANIDAIAKAAGGSLALSRFAAVLTIDDCTFPKPSDEIYRVALMRLGLATSQVFAIEDSSASLQAAKSAGIYTIATPGEFTRQQNFERADILVDSLDDLDFAYTLSGGLKAPLAAAENS